MAVTTDTDPITDPITAVAAATVAITNPITAVATATEAGRSTDRGPSIAAIPGTGDMAPATVASTIGVTGDADIIAAVVGGIVRVRPV